MITPAGVGGVPHLELELEVERHVAEVATLHPDVGPLAVLEPRDVVRRPDVDVVRVEGRVLDLAGDGLGLRDLLGLEPLALEHVLEVHVAADVELVGVVERQAPVLEQAGQHPVHDGGAHLALDVVADDRDAGVAELARPLGVRGDEHGDGVDEGHPGVEAGLGVEALGLLGAHRAGRRRARRPRRRAGRRRRRPARPATPRSSRGSTCRDRRGSGPAGRSTPRSPTAANRMVLFWPAKIALPRSTPTLAASTSKAATNSTSPTW